MGYRVVIEGVTLSIKTEEGLFSPDHADRGTLAMLSRVDLKPGQRVLDLGCGAGLVGLYAAARCGAENVWMTDVDPAAVRISRENAEINGMEGIHIVQGEALEAVDASGFHWILTNPPYQSDFAVARVFIEKSFNRLTLGGRLVMVTKRRDWYRNKLIAIFGGVHIDEVDGYFVFTAEKRSTAYSKKRPESAGRHAPNNR